MIAPMPDCEAKAARQMSRFKLVLTRPDRVTAKRRVKMTKLRVLPPSSVSKMTLRLYGALNYSPNSVRDLRFALYGA